jgi:hypothetical protein
MSTVDLDGDTEAEDSNDQDDPVDDAYMAQMLGIECNTRDADPDIIYMIV